jgi:iron complex outermembrane receptor protein
VFGQVTVNATESLRAIASLRYTNTKKRGTFDGELVFGPFPLRPLTEARGRINEGLLDPSLTIQYDITDSIMGYFAVAGGSKSGGFVSNTYGTTDATFAFEPERSRNIELGVKATLDSGRLILNAAIYDFKFNDLQVSIYNPVIQTFQTGNAASARSRGIEGQVIWNPHPSFTLSASAAYQDARHLDFPGAGCLATQPLSQCNPGDPNSIAANNIAGAPLTLASDFTGNVQGTARAPLSDDLRLDTTVILAGRTKFFNSDNQSPLFGLQPGYAKIDMRMQVVPSSQRWHVALIGTNLTNRLTTGSAFNLPAPITPVPRAILYVEPARNIAIEAGFRF